MKSTSIGASWTAPVDLGNAINSNAFSVVLDSRDSGLVLGTEADEPAWGYPVLAAQSASGGLKSSTVKRGSSTTASGIASPATKGRVVDLQVERSGLWYTVATTHESSTGKFSFTIKSTAASTYSYRAVVVGVAGSMLYGYFLARSLRVTS